MHGLFESLHVTVGSIPLAFHSGHRTIYNMCTQKPPHDYSEQLYTKYREAFNSYISEKVSLTILLRVAPSMRNVSEATTGLQVMPSLLEHRDEVLLKELYDRWQNHKLMVRWLSRFFNYLDR